LNGVFIAFDHFSQPFFSFLTFDKMAKEVTFALFVLFRLLKLEQAQKSLVQVY